MLDIDALAERVWPKHLTTTDELREYNIAQWKKAVAYLGGRWLVVRKVERKAA